MTEANTRQIAEWNCALGQRWAERQRELELMVEPFSRAVLDAAAAQCGERVLDVGCGCGASSLALAQAVGSSGQVLGIDVSQPMLEVARAHAGGLPQLAYLEGDAAGANQGRDPCSGEEAGASRNRRCGRRLPPRLRGSARSRGR